MLGPAEQRRPAERRRRRGGSHHGTTIATVKRVDVAGAGHLVPCSLSLTYTTT